MTGLVLDERVGSCTERFAVLGKTLGHSWSPVIHNTLFSQAGKDAVYITLPVAEGDLPSVMRMLSACFTGANVTIPYKESVLPLLDGLDDAARACGAVNTIASSGGRLIGYNTDGAGIRRALQERGIHLNGCRTLILGSGGAARAAAFECLKEGASVTLAARRIEAALAMRDAFAPYYEGIERHMHCAHWEEMDGAYDLLIHCTPVGMTPHEDGIPVGEEVIRRCAAVFDAVYNPRETRLIAAARQLGKTAVEGVGMLFYQAVEAQRIWFGRDLLPAERQHSIYERIKTRF